MKYRLRIPYSGLLIKLAVIIFIFFRFFPTTDTFSVGYGERDIENIQEGNIVNQIIGISVFFLTLISAVPKISEIIQFVKREKFLFIFLFWALLSVIWSNFPHVSFRRWFQIFNYYFLFVTFFSYYPVEEIIKLIKPIIYLYIIVTLIVVFTIPGALDPQFRTWRGLTNHKNSLGQAGVILTVLTFITALNETTIYKKYISFVFFFLSIIIVIGTFSSTSYIALFIFLIGNFLYYINKKVFSLLRAGNSIFIIFIIILSVSILTLLILVPEVPDLIQGIFGKSETFYDRGKLWTAVLWHFTQHPVIGCGYGAFWTIENPQILLLYQTFIWLPKQAHNGYIDLLNELGIIGAFLFLIFIFKNIVKTIKNNFFTPWIWFLILPLVSNITESNFIRVGPDTPIFLIMGYLAIEKIIEYKKEKNYESNYLETLAKNS